jgi:hypothetical protein
MCADLFFYSVRRWCSPIRACLVMLVFAGCQQRPTTVSGNVKLDGQPLTIASDARGTVVFQPDGGRGTMSTGVLDSTGHFSLATGSSLEVAPGMYYVTISVSQLLPKSDQEEQAARLITPAKYASASESGLKADVAPGENHFSFDLISNPDNGSANAANSSPDTSHESGTPAINNSTEKN